jgi:hypothetical protein
MTTLIELRRKHGVWPTLQEIGTAIDRLEAELDKLRLQMVTEVTDAEAKSARLEAELERVRGERGAAWVALQMVLDDPDSLAGRPRTSECVRAALSARQNGEGVGDG